MYSAHLKKSTSEHVIIPHRNENSKNPDFPLTVDEIGKTDRSGYNNCY